MRGRPVSCCFSGHRPEKLPWGRDETDRRCLALKEKLYGAVESAVLEGTEHFICGMAEGCDFYFCETVLALKRQFPHISLEAAIPFPGQPERWSWQAQGRYNGLLSHCDFTTVIQNTYTTGCMQRRNRYMVDHSAMLIAAHDGRPGGTRNTIEYALSRGIALVIIPV